MKHELSPLVSHDYGEEYFSAAMATVECEEGADFKPDHSASCAAIEHALLARNPQEHYACDKTSAVIGLFTSHAPACVTDVLAKFLAGTHIARECLSMQVEDTGTKHLGSDDMQNENINSQSSKMLPNNLNANNYPVAASN